MATEPDVLTVSEVAAFMRVSRETVYRLAARGELPGRKIGRIWRFPRGTIQRYVDGEPAVGHAGRGEISSGIERGPSAHEQAPR